MKVRDLFLENMSNESVFFCPQNMPEGFFKAECSVCSCCGEEIGRLATAAYVTAHVRVQKKNS